MGVISGGQVIAGAMSRSAKRSATYEYAFATDGDTTGAKSMRAVNGSPSQIPSGAIITDSFVEVLVVGDSADDSATVAVAIEGANDVVNAAAVSGAPWSTTGRKAGIPISAATSIKTTAARTPTATIAVQNLAALTFRLTVEYNDPEVG